MSTDTTTRSRRAVLGAAVGSAAAVAAGSFARPLGVSAANGENALIGAVNSGTAPTSFVNSDAGEASLEGTHAGDGTGVAGTSFVGAGVTGMSTDTTATSDWDVPSRKTGVWAAAGDTASASVNTDETGVYGFSSTSSSSTGVWGESAQGYGVFGTGPAGVVGSGDWGVYGGGNTGVIGDAPTTGVGVYGWVGNGAIPAPLAGVALYGRAETTSQFALRTTGKVHFSRSGRTYLGATATSRTISMAGVTTSSYIIATMQTNVSGVYVRAVVPASGSFKICLSKAAGKKVYVGYMVIN